MVHGAQSVMMVGVWKKQQLHVGSWDSLFHLNVSALLTTRVFLPLLPYHVLIPALMIMTSWKYPLQHHIAMNHIETAMCNKSQELSSLIQLPNLLVFFGILTFYSLLLASHMIFDAVNLSLPIELPIWLNDLSCAGNETSLIDCSHSPLGTQNCYHSKDVAIRCVCKLLHYS